MADLIGFEGGLNAEIKEARRVTRREWIIGIVCAVIGAAIGLIPYIVSLFVNGVKGNLYEMQTEFLFKGKATMPDIQIVSDDVVKEGTDS